MINTSGGRTGESASRAVSEPGRATQAWLHAARHAGAFSPSRGLGDAVVVVKDDVDVEVALPLAKRSFP